MREGITAAVAAVMAITGENETRNFNREAAAVVVAKEGITAVEMAVVAKEGTTVMAAVIIKIMVANLITVKGSIKQLLVG